MTDTETRLRDYLHAKADTVPDDDPAPGLELDARPGRRGWVPIVLAAATIGAVLVLLASFLDDFSGDHAPAAGPTLTPPGPLTDAPLTIPYKIRVNQRGKPKSNTLYDGAHKVAVPANTMDSGQRVEGGWLAGYYDGKNLNERGAAIITTDGKLRRIGPTDGEMQVVSPDHRRIAVGSDLEQGKGRITIVDVKTGKELESISSPAPNLVVDSWTQDGVWLYTAGYKVEGEVYLWQPGEGKPKRISVPSVQSLYTTPTSDVIVVSFAKGKDECMKAGVVRGAEFVVKREYCKPRKVQLGLVPLVSADGRTLIDIGSKVAIDIETGKQTQLRFPNRPQGWPEPVFENAAHLIVIAEKWYKNNNIEEEVYRCDVTTGECKLVLPMKPFDTYRLGFP